MYIETIQKWRKELEDYIEQNGGEEALTNENVIAYAREIEDKILAFDKACPIEV